MIGVVGVIAAVVTAVATVATIALEAPDRSRLAKMVASTGFLVVAIAAGALDSTFGVIVFAGLCLSWLGDLLLTLPAPNAFLGGLGAFLLGHVAYVIAFVQRGIDLPTLAVAALVVGAIAAGVLPWLLPHVQGAMRVPVIAYTAVISLMMATSAGTHGYDADLRIIVGAAAFYLSDLAVARNQFVAPGRVNRIWGLPLYYAGQLLLAWAAGG